MTSARRWVFGLTASAAGLCAGLGGAELLVRVWERLADTSEEFTYEASQEFKNLHRRSNCPGLPYELRPDATAAINYGSGRRVTYRINDLGMRGSEPRTEAQTTVLLLGDSVTFGYYVQAESTFAALLADRLGGGGTVEVLNGGVGGYNTYTELQWYRCHGKSLDPDIVVLCFCPNDVDDPYGHFAWHTLEALGDLPRAMTPNPVLSERLQAEGRSRAESWWWNTWNRIRKRSRLVWRVALFWDRRLGTGRRPFLRCLGALADAGSLESRWLGALCACLQSEVSPGASLVTVLLPVSYQVNDPANDAALDQVQTTCARLGIPTLNLLPQFRATAQSCFLDASHLSHTGHRTAAEAIAAFLEPIMAAARP
jgi:lysophospholipase L1-like esterase